ncbi:hypothetical protein B5807_06998 [Epicoccum nigrum]|uniref:Acyl-coenzyme A oxidase N-terminal domain-containing protein n=1 Tax=Epicoccum nigrum TaxID=105696 RepID=A0A1Y2LZD1_EPING|nr:hypothetical protein B5807_06998 [Epicoccum nigrum]
MAATRYQTMLMACGVKGSPESRQVALMSRSRAAGSVDTFELTCLLWGGYVLLNSSPTKTDTRRKDEVQKRREAFRRVEKTIGTHDTSKLPFRYSDASREGLYEQGLRMGKVVFEDMQEHSHDMFVWITPRYNLINAR